MSKEKSRAHFVTRATVALLRLPARTDFLVSVFLIGFAILSFILTARTVAWFALLTAGVFDILAVRQVLRDGARIRTMSRFATIEQVRDLDIYEVRSLVAMMYEADGFTVTEADGRNERLRDIDLVATKGHKQVVLIRTRDWERESLAFDVVKKVKAAVTGMNAKSAVIFSTGRCDNEASSFAFNKGVELVLGDAVLARLRTSAGLPVDRQTISGGQLDSQPVPSMAVKVTHVLFVSPDVVAVENHRQSAEILAHLLLQYPMYSVVACAGGIAGAESIRKAMPAVAERVIGATEELKGMPGQVRLLEIQRYLRSHATTNAVWFALDSKPQVYPEGTIELYPVASDMGVTHGLVNRLSDAMLHEEAKKLAIQADLAAA